MKTHVTTTYECDICGKRYYSEQDARECESTGLADLLPVGLVWVEDGMYDGIAFAIAKSDRRDDPHYRIDSMWACRDNGNGDSLGKELCGHNSRATIRHYESSWEQIATFKRLIAWMESAGVKPLVSVKGGSIVPLAEARKSAG